MGRKGEVGDFGDRISNCQPAQQSPTSYLDSEMARARMCVIY
jgi:hypothetical protein